MSSPGGGVARFVAEGEGVEPSLDAQHEIVAIGVPDQPTMLSDVVEQDSDVGTVDGRGQADARTGAPPVEVGGDDELGAGERIVLGQPRGGPGAQLELSGPPPRRQAVRKSGEEQTAGGVGVHGAGVEPDAGPTGEIAGPGHQPSNGPSIGAIVRRLPGDEGDAQREIGGKLADPSTQHVAFVDDRGEDAGRRRGGGRHDLGEARVQRQSDHRPPDRRQGPISIDGPEGAEQGHPLLPCPSRRRVGKGEALDRRTPRGDLRARGRRDRRR